MRTMHDSTTAADIPATAAMVAGYIDGDYAWSAQDWARFPSAARLRIAVFHSTDDGDVLDIEKGCSEAWCAPLWTKMRRASGLAVPTFYCRPTKTWPDAYNQAAVVAALVSGGVDPSGVAWWFADYTGQPHIPDGGVACQYANDTLTGGHFDLSVVHDSAPWVPGSPGPTTTTEDELTFTHPVTGYGYRCNPDGSVWVFNPDGSADGIHFDPANPGALATYFGALNTHPEWNAGAGKANGPPVMFGPWGVGYVITTQDAGGNFHPYRFGPGGVTS